MKKHLFIASALLFITTIVFSQADFQLSNLISPTLINQSLLPVINNSKDLGSAANSWKDLYLDGIIFIRDTPSIIITTALGTNATIVGSYAGRSNTGNNNCFYGTRSGYTNTTGSSNTIIGYGADVTNATLTNSAAIGNLATVSASNTMVLGNSSESVVIGAHAPATGYKLSVNGKIICEELKVQLLQNWPDYVFNKNYHLIPLDDLNKKIQSLHHLPNIPSADEVKKDGVSVGDMQQLMMQKIEELTLYVIQLQKQNTDLQKQVNEIKTGK